LTPCLPSPPRPIPGRHNPKDNHLIAALPAADYERLLPDLELAPLPLGGLRGGRGTGFRYFHTSSIISLLYVMEDGASS